MKLFVHVIEARDLPATNLNGLSDPYVKLKVGKWRSKTKTRKKTLNPSWDEEFSFIVGELCDELAVSVWNEDKHFSNKFLGWVKLPLLNILDTDSLSFGTAWYQLRPKNKKSKRPNRGEIRLTISLSHKISFSEEMCVSSQPSSDDTASNSDTDLTRETPLSRFNSNCGSSPLSGVEESGTSKEDKSNTASFVDLLRQVFTDKNIAAESLPACRCVESSEQLQETSSKAETYETHANCLCSDYTFDELLQTVASKDQGGEIPGKLPGGVVIDQSYVVAPGDMNLLLFSPRSSFWQSVAELQGTTGLQSEPWRLDNGEQSLKRVITYTKPASKFIKAVKVTEEQTYLKADGKAFAVLATVDTPDVPCGTYFKTEVLYCITPGPQLPSEEQSSHLLISWRINFLQSTIMKAMIESAARQGLTESYGLVSDLLSQNVKPVDLEGIGSNKEQILASLQMKQESSWKMAYRLLGNFTVISFVFVGLYVLIHLLLANLSMIRGLEYVGLDLPDSFGEIIICAVLVLQGQKFLNIIVRFFRAWKQRGSDHGVKAQGDGWLLTVALIEGRNMAAMNSSGLSDPYVVFTCNAKRKTSSIKFQTADPQWNEVFEFDAMVDLPSRMDVAVYDFCGPFDEDISLGHAEVNFVTSTLSKLADVWIPLQGKSPERCQSKLHLQIFLLNTRGNEIVKEYLRKIEKEVGKKINLRSPQTNSAFQKLFGLPTEEFLINDFTCHLKRKMPFQGRLFLSPRIIGFNANLFAPKTKFFFLWEDIADIQVIPPSLASVGSPSLMIILREGRGMDAKHGAKSQDQDGRLKFHFQSFVSFSAANRFIMALWKARSSGPEQKLQLAEEESEPKSLHREESGSFLGTEDVKMSEVFCSTIPVATDSLMEIFGGDLSEHKIMQKVGCVDYSTTPWEPVKPDEYQRQVSYKFDKSLSRYGEVNSTQQKFPLPDRNGWVIEEVMTIQEVLLGDCFNLQLKYQVEDIPCKFTACKVQVSLGAAWLGSTKHKKKIAKNITSSSSLRIKKMFSIVEKELLSKNSQDSVQ